MSEPEVQRLGRAEAKEVSRQTVQIGGVEYEVAQTSAADAFLLDWARDSLKQAGPRLDDALQKMATLAVALAGGGVVALRDDLMPHPAFRVAVVALFLTAAVTAFLGGFLTWQKVHLNDPQQIWCVKRDALRSKYHHYVCGAIALGLGLLTALIGLAIRLFC